MRNSSKQALKSNFFTLILLSFSGSLIYGLPYFRKYYYDDYIALYGLNNLEMGYLGAAYGLLGLFSYMIGGYLADRFPAKKLLILSLFTTGLGGFLHLYFTQLWQLIIIYGIWGITSLLTFWPSLMKVVRMMADESEQARAYGIFEGGRGAVSAIHLALATIIFGYFQERALGGKGVEMVIIFYSIAPICCAFLLVFLLKDFQNEEKNQNVSFKDFLTLIKMPAIWFVAAITFCTYFFNMSFYYFTPYASNIIGTSTIFAAVLTILSQYIRPVSSTVGGFVADKFGKAKVMLFGFIAMSFGVLCLILVTNISDSLQKTALIAACTLVYIAMYSNFSIYYSLLSEVKIPLHFTGIAIGVVSTFGYLPEAFAPILAGALLDAYEGVVGYYIYFSIMIAVAIIGAGFCLIWIRKFNTREKE